jgi:hypothetical protein
MMSVDSSTLEHMFEVSGGAGARPNGASGARPDEAAAGAGGPVTAVQVAAFRGALLGVCREASDAERVDLLRELETLSCAVAGAQAVVTADFDASQRAVQAAAGVRPDRQGRGIASQVALARRESPNKGQQHLGLAKILNSEMPHTLAALRAGLITQWRAQILVRETACLSLEHRVTMDRALAGDAEALAAYGEGELVGAARKLAYQLDPASVVERRRRAEADRRVSLRPAPDVMSQLSALLPVAAGVAVIAALKAEADRLRAAGDPRSRGQIMADTLVTRVTQATPQATGTGTGPDPGTVGGGGPPVVPVALSLVMSQDALLDGAEDPAFIEGYGWVPADLARALLAGCLQAGVGTWLRRLFTRPGTGDLVAMDSRSRLFPAALARFIGLRDQTCRTPWCDAPIRHRDHIVAHEQGGPTDADNGQGACVACNHAKQAPGWKARPRPGPRHTVETTTPTGHRYTSTAPPPVGTQPLATRGLPTPPIDIIGSNDEIAC